MGKKSRVKKRDKLARYEPLLARIPEAFRGRPVTVDEPVGGVKMSEVLIKYLEPYTEGLEGEEQWNQLLRFGIIAWNAALLPPNDLKESLPRIIEALPVAERTQLVGLLDQMVQRKQRFYAHDTRFILDFDFTMRKDGPFLSVVSSDAP